MNARSPHRAAGAAIPLTLALALAGCDGRSDAAAAAAATFERFQDALFAGDRVGLRASLTCESRQVADVMPLDQLAGKQRLGVVRVREQPPSFHVEVADPNEGGRTSTFVVVRESGELLVDLVATGAYHREPAAAGAQAPGWRIEPAPATAAQVRAAEAALQTRVGSTPTRR